MRGACKAVVNSYPLDLLQSNIWPGQVIAWNTFAFPANVYPLERPSAGLLQSGNFHFSQVLKVEQIQEGFGATLRKESPDTVR